MSDQITTTGVGDNATFNVYYEAEDRQKRIEWVSGSCTVNKLYSALQDLFDELTQMDDGVPMSAQTPTEYTVGIIDAGDDDPWFIDRTTVEKLTGGAIKSASWKRTLPGDGTGNTGILKVGCSSTAFNLVAGDIGDTCTHTNGDTGTILDVNTTTYEVWIRPTSSALANDWDDTSGTVTADTSSNTATQDAAGVTGESLWANIYSLGTIETDTHLYVYQSGLSLTAYKASTDWWGDEHIDILINVMEVDQESDEGYITVLARQYSKTDDYYIVDLADGGRNPIPLSTGGDLNNETGYKSITFTASAGNWNVGDEMKGVTSNARGIITKIDNPGATQTVHYYLIGDPVTTDFDNGIENLTNDDDTGTGTKNGSAPADEGPANLVTPPTIVHSATEAYDIDEDGTTENYSILIDCNQHPLTDVFEWAKYVTMRGAPDDGFTDGLEGQEYIGSDYRILHGGITGTINEGDTVTQKVTGAKGTIVALNTTDDIMILRNSRGTFSNTDQVYKTIDTDFVTPTSSTAVSPIKACPFGSFAGGVFFCAPGVVLDDVLGADVNNFQLVDDEGNVVKAPTKVSVTVGNTRTGTPPEGDRIAVFRLDGSGGDIDKARYSATVQSAGATTLVIDDGPIHYTEPGKTSGGVLRLVDVDANQEYRVRFDSWSGSTFNLDEHTTLTAEGTDSTTLTDAEATFQTWETAGTLKIGDLIRNITETAVAYVVSIDSETQLTTTPVTDWTGDSYEINTLPVDTATDDTVYIPFIDAYETVGTDGSPGSETAVVEYQTAQPTIYVRVRARNAGNIVPFEQDSTITSTGMSVSVIRTDDTIYS